VAGKDAFLECNFEVAADLGEVDVQILVVLEVTLDFIMAEQFREVYEDGLVEIGFYHVFQLSGWSTWSSRSHRYQAGTAALN